MAILRELTGVDTHEHGCYKHAAGVPCISKAITSFGSNDLDDSSDFTLYIGACLEHTLLNFNDSNTKI